MYSIDRDQVYKYFHDNAKELISEYLQPDKKGKGWICPICKNGSGEDGDGIAYNPNAKEAGHFHCFVCGFDGDLIDLIGEHYRITDDKEKLNKACEIFGITINDPVINTRKNTQNNKRNTDLPKEPPAPKLKVSNDAKPTRREIVLKILEKSLEGKSGDFSKLFKEAHSNLNDPKAVAYLKERGITKGNPCLKYMGYKENHNCGERYGENNFKGGIIFFSSNSSYCIRDIYPVPEGLKKIQKPSNKDNNHPDIPFGLLEIIRNKDKKLDATALLEPVFICEGPFDAPSIAEAGGDAISLNGTYNINPVIWAYEKWHIKRPLYLVLDNDSGGDKGLDKVKEELDKAQIEYTVTQFCPEGSDPNDFLTDNRNEFIKTVQYYRYYQTIEFEATFNRSKKEKLKEQLIEKVKYPGIKTGFSTLDGNLFLDGGLYSGLYIIGAISSLGKTTFALQIADQIAKSGQDVIFYSLEMPELEIMGKSISRNTLKNLLDSGELKVGEKPDNRAKDLHTIYRNYTRDKDGAINKALERYFNETGNHLRIIEGLGNINAEDIAVEIENHVMNTGKAPVIFIDYLQLLTQPRDRKHSMTDKQITDANVFKLKQISRDYNTPIFGISSFNRENYNAPVSMKSFKESGAIEYSSDVLIGLEPEYMGIKDPEERERKKQEYKRREEETGIRSIRLVILKNRNGYKDGVDMFDYYPKYNCYVEKGDKEIINDFIEISFN